VFYRVEAVHVPGVFKGVRPAFLFVLKPYHGSNLGARDFQTLEFGVGIELITAEGAGFDGVFLFDFVLIPAWSDAPALERRQASVIAEGDYE
jgi:hypothetical protein